MPCKPVLAAVAVLVVATSSATGFTHKPKPPKPGGGADVNETTLAGTGATQITGEVWVDNWFKLWANGAELIEDSVPITTERSFNAERFTFNADLPLTLAFEFRDFMENATGLEYIGTRKQQMGDGGAIAQFTGTDGVVLATSHSGWKCLVVQHAPIETSCENAGAPAVDQGECAQRRSAYPDGWTAPGFDDSAWPDAVEHSERTVSPKDGYDRISWDRSARLIWGADLERDNILLCRVTIR